MITKLAFGLFLLSSVVRAFAWTDGELLVWIGGDKGYRGLAEDGKKFEKDLGITVKVETPEGLTDKFQAAAQSGKGPDIVFWAHDRLGEWADSGLLKTLDIKEDFKTNYLPMSWDAVTHNKQIWGYPIALEAVSLICNQKFVTGTPPAQLSEIPAFAKELKSRDPNVIAIMWDYNTPYFSWPFVASGGGYPFKKVPGGYDVTDIGVDNEGAVKGLQAIVELINGGVMPKGASYSVMDQKMNSNELAMMISGPWAWANLRKNGIDFRLAPLPGVDGNPGRPFVGVLAGLINRSTPNSDLASQFIEKYVATSEGLKTIDADVPIGVPALKSLSDEMAAKNPLIKATYENAVNGDVMPNIPQMGKFWSSMATAFEIATNGQASPKAALDDAKKNMEK
ncbi:MAG: maltose/maltodextrin ABC transporter substrate-binding protein MalE [Verrucomicrobia bacterium]|nr:maltose/maltodextrin ABC transporter substrate-binding protein MalE [Verrucomicrobiota bacterium]MBV8375407.1 maltose/maltodextrin ABC transporter substrate-binding protein MalE [Verrucomicrobiota bacterium]